MSVSPSASEPFTCRSCGSDQQARRLPGYSRASLRHRASVPAAVPKAALSPPIREPGKGTTVTLFASAGAAPVCGGIRDWERAFFLPGRRRRPECAPCRANHPGSTRLIHVDTVIPSRKLHHASQHPGRDPTFSGKVVYPGDDLPRRINPPPGNPVMTVEQNAAHVGGDSLRQFRFLFPCLCKHFVGEQPLHGHALSCSDIVGGVTRSAPCAPIRPP